MRTATIVPGKIVVECFHCGHRCAVTNDETADAEGTRLATAHLLECAKHPLAPLRVFVQYVSEAPCERAQACRELGALNLRCFPCQARAELAALRPCEGRRDTDGSTVPCEETRRGLPCGPCHARALKAADLETARRKP